MRFQFRREVQIRVRNPGRAAVSVEFSTGERRRTIKLAGGAERDVSPAEYRATRAALEAALENGQLERVPAPRKKRAAAPATPKPKPTSKKKSKKSEAN